MSERFVGRIEPHQLRIIRESGRALTEQETDVILAALADLIEEGREYGKSEIALALRWDGARIR